MYPLGPLIQMMGVTNRQAGEFLNLNGRYYRKYATEGLSRDVAERYASKMGLHPYEVWPEMQDEDELIRALPECAAHGCENPVTPPRRGRRIYCSKRCKQRVAMAVWRARHPEVREKDRQRSRAYYHYATEYVLQRERDYYWRNREQINARSRAMRAERRVA